MRILSEGSHVIYQGRTWCSTDVEELAIIVEIVRTAKTHMRGVANQQTYTDRVSIMAVQLRETGGCRAAPAYASTTDMTRGHSNCKNLRK